MKCNTCWRELNVEAVTTVCGSILCPEDAEDIRRSVGTCPICDQVLLDSHMKPVDITPSDAWVNMALTGMAPRMLMKSMHSSVMFFIGQKELEFQYKMHTILGKWRESFELMQTKFAAKLEEVHAAYQEMAKRCQLMEQEIENLKMDKQELHKKIAEKSRKKRKLDEMYDQLRNEYESAKNSRSQARKDYVQRAQPGLFSGMPNIRDRTDPLRQGLIYTPETSGCRQRDGLHNEGNVASTMVHLGSTTKGILLLAQFLRWVSDPESHP